MQRIHVFIDSEADDKTDYEKSCADLGCQLHIFNMDEARIRYDYVHRASPSMRSAGQARNMFQDFAKSNGIEFYCVQDDDTKYMERIIGGRKRAQADEIRIVFAAIEELMRSRHIGVLALPQNGDLMSGEKKYTQYTYKHKVMNCTFYLLPYIYRGERGVQDDDTSMFCGILNAGLFTGTMIYGITLQQCGSAQQKGGLTDLYNECKLLNKAIICPLQFPSAIHAQRQVMNGNRIHHRIEYRYLAPCILRGDDPKRDNIAWDKYPEDVPFTQESIYQEWRKKEIRQPNN